MYGKTLTKGFEEGFKNLRQFLYKHYLPRRFKFNSMVAQNPNKYFSIRPEQWHHEKQERKSIDVYLYVCVFVVGFSAADFLNSLCHDQKQSYRLYVSYPKYTKAIDNLLEHEELKPWLEIAKGVWVKDFVEFRAFWDKVATQIWEKSRKQKEEYVNVKANQLKRQYEEFNTKYPMPRKEDAESVY